MTQEATSEPAAPPPFAIEMAISAAGWSPCKKSRRGVVAYMEMDKGPVVILGMGFNSSPRGWVDCDGSDACRAICGQVCVHAEDRAIRAMIRAAIDAGVDIEKAAIHLVHVKLGDRGRLVAGGPPSCWPCANLVAEEKIHAVWLYEDMHEGPAWVRWPSVPFYESTLHRQPKHPLYMARNGIEQPCLWCRAQDGAKRDHRGFWRCIRCREPGQ